ncbi:MAG TPA: response regulator transcription factor [Anaerolineae bacterium]
MDDSILMRERLARVLSNVQGVQIVGEAVEADAASISILQLHPDVVILDIELARGTGMDVLQTIKKNKPSPVVMMVTNYPEFRAKCLQAGADYFFDKSTEFLHIPLVVGDLVKQAREGRGPRLTLN